jgi:hypothetical protein
MEEAKASAAGLLQTPSLSDRIFSKFPYSVKEGKI